MRFITKVSFWGILITLLLLACGAFFFFFSSYEAILDYAVQSIQRPDIRKEIELRFFPKSKYDILHSASIFIGLICIGFSYLLFLSRQKIQSKINKGYDYLGGSSSKFIGEIQSSSKVAKLLLAIVLILISIRSVFIASTNLIQYDEAWNYNYFLANGFWNAILAYNNYPLHNLFCKFFISILPDTTFTIRLSSMIFGLLATITIFVGSKRYFKDEWIGLFSSILFASFPLSLFYMLYARGQMLNIFFAGLCFFLLLKENKSNKDWILVYLLNALALYSMLSHLFFIIVSFGALILHALHSKKSLGPLFKYLAFSILASVVLLLPMMLGTGMGLGLSSNYSGQILEIGKFISYYEEISYFYSGFSYFSYAIVAINIALLFGSKKHTKLALLNLSILLLPILLPLVSKTFLPERSLSFIIIPVVLSLAVLLMKLKTSFKPVLTTTLVIISCVILNYTAYNHFFLNWSKKNDEQVHLLASILLKKEISECYNNETLFNYYLPGIEYYYRKAGKKMVFFQESKKSARYLPLKDYKGNCIALNPKRDSIPPGFVPIWTFRHLNVYHRQAR